jgi:hypothetical protein
LAAVELFVGMALFKKKADPISDRARVLTAEIEALESKIKKLDSQLQQNQSHPRLRTTALPHGATVNHLPETPGRTLTTPAVSPAPEPVFEEVDRNRLKGRDEAAVTPEHFNDLGVRKYDLPALFARIRNQFRGPSTTNPKLVSYLAAGGVQGLRPLRYEKRVARNRFLFFAGLLLLALLGILLWLYPRR